MISHVEFKWNDHCEYKHGQGKSTQGIWYKKQEMKANEANMFTVRQLLGQKQTSFIKFNSMIQRTISAITDKTIKYKVFMVAKFLIPKRTLSKSNILGGDSKYIVQALSRQMDISVIPQYLGGQNKRTYKDDLVEDQQEEKYLQSQ